MRIAIVGGTGTLGTALVSELAARGEEVVLMSRSPGEGVAAGARWQRADLTSGEGLAAGLAGVDAVVDAGSSRSRPKAVLVRGTERLLRAAAEAGVGHYLTASIVGCDRVPMGYYRAKVAQEETVAAGPVPWTVLRATQFHPFVAEYLAAAARLRLRPSSEAKSQPVDVGVVARRLAEAAPGEPAGRLPDLAGPEVRTMTELGRAWAEAEGRRLAPLRVPFGPRLGRALREGGLCDPEAATPGPTFEEWLAHGR